MLMISNTAAFIILFLSLQKLCFFQQRFFQKLCCTSSTAVCGSFPRLKLDKAGVEIHPAVVRQTEAFVYPRPFERTHGVGVAGIANKQRRNIRTHVSGLGLYAAHPVLMGIVTALGEDVFRQVGNVENVNILVAVGLPKLLRP